MKRRIILWTAGILALLVLTRCHFVFPPLRRADAVITVKTTGYCACPKCSGWRFNWLGLPVSQNGKMKVIGMDDIPRAQFSAPPLSSYRQPLDEMVACAVDLALGKRKTSKLFEAEFVARNSLPER